MSEAQSENDSPIHMIPIIESDIDYRPSTACGHGRRKSATPSRSLADVEQSTAADRETSDARYHIITSDTIYRVLTKCFGFLKCTFADILLALQHRPTYWSQGLERVL